MSLDDCLRTIRQIEAHASWVPRLSLEDRAPTESEVEWATRVQRAVTEWHELLVALSPTIERSTCRGEA